MLARLVFLLLLFSYVATFLVQEKIAQGTEPTLSRALPVPVQRVSLGYLKEVAAEILFVKAAVFIGGLPPKFPPEKYADDLAQNFDTMTELYPEFVDPYYLCQANLAYISHEYAGRAIDILRRGGQVRPDDMILPFFMGFNYFYYLKQPAQAAAIFAELAVREGAPPWLGSLAAALSARGGDLFGGLLTLQVMAATEEDELVRARYETDIALFREAIRVFEATRAFERQFGRYPEKLEELVPGFMPYLPDLRPRFEMKWDPPDLKLDRPGLEGK